MAVSFLTVVQNSTLAQELADEHFAEGNATTAAGTFQPLDKFYCHYSQPAGTARFDYVSVGDTVGDTAKGFTYCAKNLSPPWRKDKAQQEKVGLPDPPPTPTLPKLSLDINLMPGRCQLNGFGVPPHLFERG